LISTGGIETAKSNMSVEHQTISRPHPPNQRQSARPAHGFPGIPLFAIVHAVSEFIWGVSDNKDMV
jgi:hypothetical protein